MRKQIVSYLLAMAMIILVVTFVRAEEWTHFTGDNITIPEHPIDMAIDHDGVLWVGNWFGLWSYDGVEWETWWLNRDGECLVPYPGDETLPYRGANRITVDENNVKWVTMFGGVVKYDGNTWDFIPNDDEFLWGTIIDHADVMWFGTAFNGVWSFNGAEWSHYSVSDMGLTSHDTILGAAVDSRNVKWFTYSEIGFPANYGVIRFDGATWKVYIVDRKLDDWHESAVAVAADADDVVWLGTGEGVFSFQDDNLRDYHCYEIWGSGGAEVLEIAIGLNNVKWFGTSENGVTSYDGENWRACKKFCVNGKRELY